MKIYRLVLDVSKWLIGANFVLRVSANKKNYLISKLKPDIQGVSEGIVNILGGGSMDYSEQISLYKHVSNFQWV